jgi:SNF2 family DNA or RNA helicase
MQAVGVAKVDDIVELRSTVEGPCVIMVTHKEVVARLKEKLDCVTVTGEDSAAAKDKAVTDFQSGRVQTIVCNTAAGGVGLTLTAASTMIVGEIPWSPAVLRQAEDRIHRIGAKRSCQYLYVVGENSLDNSILATIRSKESYLRPVLGDAA